ncbi:MAG: hypothetical protein F6J97_10095 [Leptolyngbya sp. SIO4C1]|nr:hypothetical protein [Leptolyngbya sp. SIO4C1]
MFILKRQDVEIKSFQHPSKDQKIPILTYQGQTFRLLSVFSAVQEEEARALWRDLTDNRGKACVLLEEPERFSIWGKVRLEPTELQAATPSVSQLSPAFIQAGLLILQALYEDIEDLLGARQAHLFERDLAAAGSELQLPQADSSQAIQLLLRLDPLYGQLPTWQEADLNQLLKALYRIAKTYFGNAAFTGRALEALEELSTNNRILFMKWLSQSPNAEYWQ